MPATPQPDPPTVRLQSLLGQYERGAAELRAAIAGMTAEELHARPIPGKWSTHEIVCHLADAEMLYADRMKRVLAEDQPAMAALDPDTHVGRLALKARDVHEEVALIDLVRRHMLRILKTLSATDYERQGRHSEAGLLTLETLLERIAGHIPHHARFIAEKRAALAGRPTAGD